MKKGIHPNYHEKVTMTCSCGNSFEVGSTVESIEVEVCAMCHPFYTGKQKLVDTAGRIDRFKKRLESAEVAGAAKPKESTAAKPRDDKEDNIVKL